MQIPTRYEAIGLGGSNLHMSLVPDRDFPLVCKLGMWSYVALTAES